MTWRAKFLWWRRPRFTNVHTTSEVWLQVSVRCWRFGATGIEAQNVLMKTGRPLSISRSREDFSSSRRQVFSNVVRRKVSMPGPPRRHRREHAHRRRTGIPLRQGRPYLPGGSVPRTRLAPTANHGNSDERLAGDDHPSEDWTATNPRFVTPEMQPRQDTNVSSQ